MNKRPLLSTLFAILFLAAFLPACRQNQTDAGAAADPRLDFTIVPGERVGLITADKCTQADVLAAYGDSARVDSVYLVEGLSGPGVVVFPNDNRNRLEIYWDQDIDPQRPVFMRIVGEGGSGWKTDKGITIGTPIAEVERINGRAFSLYGFGWDYGGLVTDWKGGALDSSLGLHFHLFTEKDVPAGMQGEAILSSDDATVRGLNPLVAAMELSFPRSSLMPLMQGRWQSVSDPGYQVEIDGDKIRHYNGGELTMENEIEADADCTGNACTVAGTRPDGFCFIEKGQFDAQCNLVLACDGQRLEYAAIGAAGQSLVFTRVN